MRLWTMPVEPPPIYVATAGTITAEKTGRLCDGIITVGAAESKLGGLALMRAALLGLTGRGWGG